MESFDSSDSLTIIDPNSKKKNRNLIDAPDYIPVDANQNQAFRNHMQEELILMGKFPPIGKILICDGKIESQMMPLLLITY